MLCRSVSIDAWYAGAASIVSRRKERHNILSKAWHDELQKTFFRKEENMKKIFAFVLATIMVLSLVPASAFAAFTKCPTTHTSTNCPAKLVQTALADCQNPGYQVFVCEDCGEQFLDNFTEALEHAWVSDKELAAYDVAANCVYKTNGVQHVICAVCEETDVITVDYRSSSIHNLKFVSGIGCEKVYACSVCGDEGFLNNDGLLVDAAAHTYEYKSIISEPFWKDGVATNGAARYECAVEGCSAWKEVEVLAPDCKHATKKLVVPAKAEDCVSDGTYAVYQCPDCSALFVDYNEDNDPKTVKYDALTDTNGDEKVTLEDAIIDLVAGHTPPAEFTQYGCTRTYVCVVCNQNVTEEYHAYTTDTLVAPATCMTMGITYKACVVCGTQWPEFTEPAGHQEAYVIIPSTCATQGGKYTICTKEECPLNPTFIKNDATQTPYKVVSVELFPLDSSKHDLVSTTNSYTATNPTLCTDGSIKVTTCNNGCAAYATPKVEYTAAKTHTFIKYRTIHNCYIVAGNVPAWTTRTFYQCVNSGCGLNTRDNPDIRVPAYDDVRDTSIKMTFADLDEAKEYHGLIYRDWGYKSSSDKTVVVKTTGPRTTATHQLVETGVVVPATCTAAGYKEYMCSGCGQIARVTIAKAKHTDGKFTPGKPATCNTAGVRDSYNCKVCNTVYYYDGTSQKTGSLAIKPCASTVVKVPAGSAAGNCYEYYMCTVCNTCYTKADCATKVVDDGHVWKVLTTGVAATCNKNGTIEVRACTKCNTVQANTLYIIGGEEVRTISKTGSAKYDKGANTFTFSALTDNVTGDVTVKVAKNGAATFVYQTVTTSYCPVETKKLEHVNYATGESYITTSTNLDETVDHKEAAFTKNYCTACEYEFITNYVAAAGGHVNNKGNILTTKCENEGVAGGRVCVLCVAAGATEPEATITVAHKFTETKGESTATCIKNGVTYQYCTECGHYELTSDIAFADAKAFHEKLLENEFEGYDADEYTVGTTLDYAHNGASYFKCPECGVKLTDLEEEKMKASGLEIYLSTDATEYIPGSKVFVTVSLDSLNGINVWGLNFPVIFNPEVFKFVGSEFNTADSDFQTFAVNEVPGGYEWSDEYPACQMYGPLSTGVKGKSGVLSIVANADGNVLVKGAQDLVVLEFVIISAEAANERFEVGTATVTDLVLGPQIKDIDPDAPLSDANLYTIVRGSMTNRYYSVDVINANGKAVDALYNGSNYSKYITITGYLDLDGKDGITMADAYELYSLIYNNEYDVKADADFDGAITAKDLSMLYAILTGAVTVEQIVSPDAELPEGFEAWMGAK